MKRAQLILVLAGDYASTPARGSLRLSLSIGEESKMARTEATIDQVYPDRALESQENGGENCDAPLHLDSGRMILNMKE